MNNIDGDDEGITNGDDDEEAKQAYVGDSEGKEKQTSEGDKEGAAKQASVACSLKYSNEEDYIDTVEVDFDKEFWSSFLRDRNSRNFILGGPQNPDTMGMTTAEKEATLKKYRKEKSHSLTKNICLS